MHIPSSAGAFQNIKHAHVMALQVPETLIGALKELEEEYEKAMKDPEFKVRNVAYLGEQFQDLTSPSCPGAQQSLCSAGTVCPDSERLRWQGVTALPCRAAFRALQKVLAGPSLAMAKKWLDAHFCLPFACTFTVDLPLLVQTERH